MNMVHKVFKKVFEEVKGTNLEFMQLDARLYKDIEHELQINQSISESVDPQSSYVFLLYMGHTKKLNFKSHPEMSYQG